MYSKFSLNPKIIKQMLAIFAIVLIFFGIHKMRQPIYPIPLQHEKEDSVISSNNSEQDEHSVDIPFSSTPIVQNIVVYVTGEVKNPGIVELTSEHRVKDAIDAVGGFTENADLNSINLAAKLQDEQHYIVHKIGEISAPANSISSTSFQSFSAAPTLININRAGVEELKTLDGIGDALAQRIIDYRTEKGNFSSIEDIRNVTGIGEKKYDAIKDHITVK